MKCYNIYADKECNTIIENDIFCPGFVYVYVLQRIRANGSAVNQVVIKENVNDPVKFTIGEDGYYLLCKLIIPRDITKPYYYYSGRFYKGNSEIELQELIDTNPAVSQIEIVYEDYFQICNLRKCFINICQKIFDDTASLRCEIKKADKELIYKRDLIWSAINVIKYLVEQKQFDEAERLLQLVMYPKLNLVRQSIDEIECLKKKVICEYNEILRQLECGIQPDIENLLEEISLIDIYYE